MENPALVEKNETSWNHFLELVENAKQYFVSYYNQSVSKEEFWYHGHQKDTYTLRYARCPAAINSKIKGD
jgi:hypothetical protein